VTRRSPLFIAACVMAAAVLLPSEASAQRRGPRVAPRTSVVVGVGVGSPYYYRPYIYDPWYPYYWYPSPYYYGGRYYDDGASLRLQVSPRQAEVFVDGYYAGIVDDFDGAFQRLQLEPGEHELQLFLPGYRPMEQRLYLQPRSTFRVRHTMEPLAPGDPQPLRPTGSPAGPSGQGVAPGPRSQGPGPATRGPQTRAAAPRGAEYGTLAIRVQPGDAEVLIDGERWEGASGDERLVVQLAPGPHRIEVRKDGYRAFATDVDVRPGETAPLNVSLARPR
jgi:hypothetical protein